jgi:hypothetical protein
MITDTPLSFYVDKINSNENFKFLRFGDGELLCYAGIRKSIGRGEHDVWANLTHEIRGIMKNLKPDHINGLQPLSLGIPELAKHIPDYPWHNSDVFHNASMAGQLFPFFNAIDKRNVVIVSTAKTKAVPIRYNGFIEIRPVNCYHDKDMVLGELEKYPANTIFLFCASRMSVPVIYHSSRNDCTMIDLGSLFEPYIGNKTRNYHDRLTPEIIKKNLHG